MKFSWPLEKRNSCQKIAVSDVTMVDCLIGGEIEEISPSKENATFHSVMSIKLIDISGDTRKTFYHDSYSLGVFIAH